MNFLPVTKQCLIQLPLIAHSVFQHVFSLISSFWASLGNLSP
jgi:hypothetical protein